MEWKTVKLGDVCDLIAGFAFKAGDFGDYPQKVVKIGDINPPHVTYASMSGIDLSKYDVKKLEKFKVQYGDYVLAMTGATIGKVGKYIDSAFSYLNQRVLMFKPKPEVDAQFVNYVVCSAYFRQYVMNHIDSESAQPNISATTIGKYEFLLPSLDEQHRIAAILSSLDDKIENNNRINRNLKAQAQALFKSWFVDFEPWGGTMPEDWREDSLTNIADFLNGLAMQKFPAKDIENSLPVLKIKELGQKHCDESSDRCTKEIKPEYIIHDGDVIFSWSGTLLVDIWCGGDCGLNQHLFKVSSNKYPKWFYYLWTIQHLQNFKRIASDKAVTMGHIKRGDLDKSIVLIPNDNVLEKMTAIMTPLLDSIVSNAQESARLATLRDTLLPKLMKGEIEL